MARAHILTGWSVDYACAAAVAFRRFCDPRVVAVSKRKLPRYLKELASRKRMPQSLYILGVALTEDMDMTAEAVALLKKKGVKLVYITKFTPYDELLARFSDFIEFRYPNKDKSLTQVAKDKFAVKQADVAHLLHLVECPVNERSDDDQQRIDLLDAANWQHRVNDDVRPYSKAIATIAEARAIDAEQKQLLRTYDRFKTTEMRGDSQAMRDLWESIKAVGNDGECSVLIGGETGTGKEIVANLIHLNSPRTEAPFEAINCATLTPQLLRSELFGHKKGSFTGAHKNHKGAFERADGGTLFLDEIGEMPPDLQAALLRALQQKRFTPIGGEAEIAVDTRVIAATNRNLWDMVREGTFRMDLLFRLNVIELQIPPLRRRKEDIAAIANGYLMGQKRSRLTATQTKQLCNYDWPGNVRQLLNILDRARILGNDDFAAILQNQPQLDDSDLPDSMEGIMRWQVARIFRKYNRNQTHAAQALGISINTLKRHLDEQEKHGID